MEGGPQFDVPVGNTGNSQPGGASGWQGMTIKDILEKVDLFNVTSMVDDGYQKIKDTKAPLMTMHNAKNEKSQTALQPRNSAFLGPKIWKKPLNIYKYDGGEDEGTGTDNNRSAPGAQFSLMNIDEFLTENNFDIGRISPPIAADAFDQGGVQQGTPYS